jgi:hypothetical protein
MDQGDAIRQFYSSSVAFDFLEQAPGNQLSDLGVSLNPRDRRQA